MKNIIKTVLISSAFVMSAVNADALKGKDYGLGLGAGVLGYIIGSNTGESRTEHRTTTVIHHYDDDRLHEINIELRRITRKIRELKRLKSSLNREKNRLVDY